MQDAHVDAEIYATCCSKCNEPFLNQDDIHYVPVRQTIAYLLNTTLDGVLITNNFDEYGDLSDPMMQRLANLVVSQELLILIRTAKATRQKPLRKVW